MTCAHPKMPDLGGGNPLSFQQCPDCQSALYWDDGWQISGIQLAPNSTGEQRAAALISEMGRQPKPDPKAQEALKKKLRSAKPLHCPQCGKLNEWSDKERTTCAHCHREFSVKVGMRFRRRGRSLPEYKKAWKLFSAGKKASEISRELNIGYGTVHRWGHLWRSGVEMPE